MESMKKKVLIIAADKIKKVAIAAAGTTSFWGTYQPEEPNVLTKK